MPDLFSRSFHSLWLPRFNLLPPKPSSQTLPFSKRFFTSHRHIHFLPHSTSSSTPAAPQQQPQDLHVISSTQLSDGSFVFKFGNASEIREIVAELDKQKLVSEGVEEVGVSVLLSDDGVSEKLSNEIKNSDLGEEVESSSTLVVGVVDQNPQLLVSENESSVVLDSYPESETPVINDLEIIDKHLKLDSVEDGDGDGQHGICNEDVAAFAEPNVVPSVSTEDSQVDSHREVVDSTVALAESDVFSELSSGASLEVEEKEVDNGRGGVGRAANSSTGGVDGADLTELVQVSNSVNTTTNNLTGIFDVDIGELEPVSDSLESEQDGYSATDDLTDSVGADITELVSVSTSGSEQVGYNATDNLTGSADASSIADTSDFVPVSTSLESDQVDESATENLTSSVGTDITELVSVSMSSDSEQVGYNATDNLTGSADASSIADTSDYIPVSTSLESDQVDGSAIDNLSGSVDAAINELVPVSPSLESEQIDYSGTDNLVGSVDTDNSELISGSTSLESKQVEYSATDDLTGSVDADDSDLLPISTSLEPEQVDYSVTGYQTDIVDESISELAPVSASLDSEQSVDRETTDVNVEFGELLPISTYLESKQVDDSATDDLTGSVDADDSDLLPMSTSLDPEQVDYRATNNQTDSVDDSISELVPVSASLDSEQSADRETNLSTADVNVEFSELLPISTSSEPEQVDYSAKDSIIDSISELVPVSASLDSEQSVDRETNLLAADVNVEFSELLPISTSSDPEQVDCSAIDSYIDTVDDGISELVPVSASLDSEQSVDRETNLPTADVDVDFSELVPIFTSSASEQVDYSAADNLTGGVDSDLSESKPVSTSLGYELHSNDDETGHQVVDDSVDTNKMEQAVLLRDLVPSSDLENKIVVDNTEISDYENPLLTTVPDLVPELHSVGMATDGENITKTKFFLVSGAACLAHPSEVLTNREDAYFITPQNWLVVADGVGQWSLEGSNTGVYIRELMENCEDIVSNCDNISMIKPAEVLVRSAAETQSPGSSSVLVAYFDGQALHAANVGNTGFIIIRDGSIFKISNAMFHELGFPIHIVKGDDHSEIIEEYKIDLYDGDMIVFATNGLFDNLYEKEIASTVSKSLQAGLKPQEIAEMLATRAQEVGRSRSTRSPFGDAAKALGYVGYAGGKLDDVTVIVSLVQTT